MSADAPGAVATPSDLRKRRLKLAHRRRRIILNNDGDDIGRLTMEAMREVCQTYDIDGIELDF